MMNQNIKTSPLPLSLHDETIEINLDTQTTIDYRLELLRVTFTIEENLEERFRKIFNNRVKIDEFKESCISEVEFKNFRKWYKGKKVEQSIFNSNKAKGDYFNHNNFVKNSTFGGLVKLLSILKMDVIKIAFEDQLSICEWSVIKAWYLFVVDIRNALAHRTWINPETFFDTGQTPRHSSKINVFNQLSTIKQRKFVVQFFINFIKTDGQIDEIMDKHFSV